MWPSRAAGGRAGGPRARGRSAGCCSPTWAPRCCASTAVDAGAGRSTARSRRPAPWTGASGRSRIDLKPPEGVETLLRLVERADVLFEVFRPGVAERLGIGPDDVPRPQPAPRLRPPHRLGPGRPARAQAAGHDIDYLALAGALEPLGRAGAAADAADQRARRLRRRRDAARVRHRLRRCSRRARTGKGQVIDAAMVDGAAVDAHAVLRGARAAASGASAARTISTPAPPSTTSYETADGGCVAVGADRAAVLRRARRAARARRRRSTRPVRPGPLAGAEQGAARGGVPHQDAGRVVRRSSKAPTPASRRCSRRSRRRDHPHNRRAARSSTLGGRPPARAGAPVQPHTRTPHPRRRCTRAPTPSGARRAGASTPTRWRRCRPRARCCRESWSDAPSPSSATSRRPRDPSASGWPPSCRRDRRRRSPPITGPSFTGFSNETLIFDATWNENGTARTSGYVIRVKPTAHTDLPRVRLRLAVHGHEGSGDGTDVPLPPVHWFEDDESGAGRAVLRDGQSRRAGPGRQPAVHAAGLDERRGHAGAAGAHRRERPRRAWRAIHQVDWQALGLDPCQAAVRRARLRPAARLLRDVVRVGREGSRQPVAEARSSGCGPTGRPARAPALAGATPASTTRCSTTTGNFIAVLDWEMVTLADPMMDLAWWLFLDKHFHEGMPAPRLEGFPTREEMLGALRGDHRPKPPRHRVLRGVRGVCASRS